MTRAAHWIKPNHQERIPARMVAFDTESRSSRCGEMETQEWRIGCAIRWRTDLKTGDHAEPAMFSDEREMWEWISDFCKAGTRTVVWAHNLSHDARIASVFTILPEFGFELEWFNLDRNVSAMTWRSDHGTIVFADTYTWLPLPLDAIAVHEGIKKLDIPKGDADEWTWNSYCMRDAEIVYRAVSQLVSYIRAQRLGNWQPTGAGMAYAMWRHRFLGHKILVHDNDGALVAERSAMHTGRAEAWRHGRPGGGIWTEVDLKNAYVTIGANHELPRKLRFSTKQISLGQYRRLSDTNRVLCLCHVRTTVPSVPCRQEGRTLWPVGEFLSWLWDTEVDCAIRYGAEVSIRQSYVYARDFILRDWAEWVLSVCRDNGEDISPVVRTWVKHCSRALIGRLSLKTRNWEEFGENPEHYTGITYMTDLESGDTRRLMHVGDKTLIENQAEESHDSVPMITGWIMAHCRVMLWDAMNTAGLGNVAHVDTDSLIVNAAGLANLREGYAEYWDEMWAVKGSWRSLEITGPRCYYRGRQRVMAGIPGKAERVSDGLFQGERWASLASDLGARGDGVVTTWAQTWEQARTDPRRRDAPGAGGYTEAYTAGFGSSSKMSSDPMAAEGE